MPVLHATGLQTADGNWPLSVLLGNNIIKMQWVEL